MREYSVAWAERGGLRGYRKSELSHCKCKTDGGGYYRFSAAVGSGYDEEHTVRIEREIVRHKLVLDLQRDYGIDKSFGGEALFFVRKYFGEAERAAAILQLSDKLGGFRHEFDLGDHAYQKVRVLEHIRAYDLLPRVYV